MDSETNPFASSPSSSVDSTSRALERTGLARPEVRCGVIFVTTVAGYLFVIFAFSLLIALGPHAFVFITFSAVLGAVLALLPAWFVLDVQVPLGMRMIVILLMFSPLLLMEVVHGQPEGILVLMLVVAICSTGFAILTIPFWIIRAF